MIIQCDSCQTRFRIADEKVKPGGSKVRCSRCKAIFTIFPPPEPADDTVDFGSFNMEKVSEDSPGQGSRTEAGVETGQWAPSAWQSDIAPRETDPSENRDLDFDAAEDDLRASGGQDQDASEDFSPGDTAQPVQEEQAAVDEESQEFDFSFSDNHFSSDEEVRPAAEPEEREAEDFPEEESAGPVEFSFDDEDQALAFNFDETEEEESPSTGEDQKGPGEFSFDDEVPFGDDSAGAWGESTPGDDSGFDFDEPRFDTEETGTAGQETSPEGGLQFDEIDFPGQSEAGQAPGSSAGEASSRTSDTWQQEEQAFSQRTQSPAKEGRAPSLDEPVTRPSPPKKGSLSRILTLLVLLLIVLGGAAGYLYMQEGTLNLRAVARYLPFLKDYLGEPLPAFPGERIGLNIIGSSYVNGQAGQMLVIQGTAINNYPTTRSAITIKGILLDVQGKKLLQQTVFCGNKLDEPTLRAMSFAAIEEAMNNQFGDSLSNMNVAPGGAIPFTIVFRNLPAGIANINVEVVDSKPGAG